MGKKMRQINAALPQGLAYQCRVCGSAQVNLHVLASLARGLAYPGNGRWEHAEELKYGTQGRI